MKQSFLLDASSSLRDTAQNTFICCQSIIMRDQIPPSILEQRLSSFRKQLEQSGIESAIITDEINGFYFTGFNSSNSIIIVTKDQAIYLTDFRYYYIAKNSIKHFDVRELHGGEVWDLVMDICKSHQLGLPFYSLTYEYFLKVSEKLRPADYYFVDIGNIIKSMRAIKDNYEIALMTKALRNTEDIVISAFRSIKPSISEKTISNNIIKSFIDSDTCEAFETIVAFSENAANCHAVPQSHRIMSEELSNENCCLIDMGCKFQNYCSDLTRTVLYNNSNSKLRSCFEIVNEANLAATEAVKPGVLCSDIDLAGRKIIDLSGYGDCFGHSIGHGVGIQTHEEPFVSKTSSTVLKPGMVITIEPGIYIKDEFGIRIENMVLVTETGYEVMTKLQNNILPLL